MINIYRKDSNIKLNRFLNSDEMDCQCSYEDCCFTYIEEKAAFAFHQVRSFVSMPLNVNSGHRCQRHNKDVGGIKDSKHLIGHAIDIKIPKDIMDIPEEVDYLIEMCETFFDVAIHYKDMGFIHCHINPETEEIEQ